MMYVKLALKNARRFVKDYLIYVVTLIICVTLFYAFLSISSRFYQPDIGQEFNIKIFGNWIKIAVFLITLLLIFLMWYVNKFMFRQRQKEFALQSIIGMEQKVIAWLFFVETFVIGFFALAAGILLGTVCSQFVTAMLMQMFGEPFHFSLMLFPDTVLLTMLFFCLCFSMIGMFQMRTIRKTKIIDMLRADRENESRDGAGKWMCRIAVMNLFVHLLIGVYGIRTLSYYFAYSFSNTIRVWCLGCMMAPFMMLLASVLWIFLNKQKSLSRYLYLMGAICVPEILFVGFLPVFKIRFSFPMDTGAYNSYLAFLGWCSIFMVSVFFFLFNRQIAILKRNSAMRYHRVNLFFFGQILSKLNTNTKAMTTICLTLAVSIALFLLTPFLTGWAKGYLDKRTPYDIQMYSDYAGAENIRDLPQEDYHFMDALLEEYRVQIADDAAFKTYFLKETDFYENAKDKTDYPVMAVSLSDYNHLMNMLGYESVSLTDNEFATQWISTANDDSIQQFLKDHAMISTDAGTLSLSMNKPQKSELGETLYGYQNVIYIVPDSICGGLRSANTFRYMKTEEPLSYTVSAELENLFYENDSIKHCNVYYHMQTKTKQVNDTSSAIYVLQTVLIYSAIVLFVICFTILALQQLYDAGKYKYRFQVLKNMGVEEADIRRLILRQLGLWFGVPVGLAVILAGVFFAYLLFSFSMQIAVYVGIRELFSQVFIVLSILMSLFLSYFISTLVLFERSALGGG